MVTQQVSGPCPSEDLAAAERGLTSAEARRQLAEDGPNEPAPPRHQVGLVQLLLRFGDPLAVILLIASAVSAVLGEVINASIIAVIVVLSVAIDFYQTYRSHRVAERLREQVAVTATVRRDGSWIEVPRRQLVRGDIIRLGAGDLVPADARLLQARDLHVQQAALTGESLPVEKSTEPGPEPTSANAHNLVFLGTSVVSGSATAVVTATGRATAFGDIAARLAARPPETEFERGSRRFSVFIMEVVLLLIAFLFLVTAALHRDPLQSLLFAVALAVGLTPEFLPMITTVTLARGAVRMARQKVIVKHLAAMQNFGSMDILCSDKTGTLTAGTMVLDRSLDPFDQPSDRVLLLASVNSAHETGIKSPLDAAILAHGHLPVEEFHKIDEIPFDFERRRVSIVVERRGERLLITKGAPEGVLELCSKYEADGQIHPLDERSRDKCTTTYQSLSAEGLRVLAVAFRPMEVRPAYKADDEQDLVLAGFVCFVDPPLEDAAAAIEDLRRDGVEVKILTGDNELVARHTCAEVGLNAESIVLGEAVDRMTDSALGKMAERTVVFARVSPAQKNRVLLALKARGHVVGFLGDGINDAPSLHAADVGISVAGAVDVAKDAAEIILVERSLRVLHTGIIEGRRAFGNVMKYLLMGTSSNFGNMLSMAVATLFLPFLPMLPTQILLNSFLYDVAQLTIPTDNVDPSFIHKPRRWDIAHIRNFMLLIGPISSVYDFLTFAALLTLFHASEELFHTGWFVESLATQTLVLFVIRTAGNPLTSRPSRALTATVLLIVIVGVALPYTPLSGLLGFVPLPVTYLVFLMGVTSTYLIVVEWVKRVVLRRFLD